MRGGFLAFLDMKLYLPLFRLIRFRLSPSIKWFLSHDLSFSFDFSLFFYVFIADLLWRMIVCCCDSEGIAASIKQINHLKSLFVNYA